MRVLLDACVLYPTVMREVLLGAAAAGFFTPLWSPRILEEWARATAKLGPEGMAVARAEIAVLRDRWPDAEVTPQDGAALGLSLPDPDDIHVLAAAIAGRAEILCTLNLQDFPTLALAAHRLMRRDPDGLLRGFHDDAPDRMAQVAAAVRARAEAISGQPQPLRALLKKARLPRLAKALAG
ncbi:PIN domain-containing protein [Maritimibacter sp. 55A14]|uniref:RSP_2648 family PIN domain-containing protein n=1 Tax=Maritimibacter sp. 55A14 TaxID=2174844 RepID=UPI000D605F08|nr:PIN domain-containing protein [Maritimibacter sp. 55A14]PWE33990.1 PIN domain-containing protein [Maritimibacter sp. 55A14]